MTDGVTPLTKQQEAAQQAKVAKEGYIERELVAIDIATNVTTGGHEDETISSRLARDAAEHHVVGEIGSKLLDLVQKDHGAKAVAGDLERAKEIQAVEEKSGLN